MSEDRNQFRQLVASALISGSVAAALVGGGLKFYLDGRLEEFRARRAHDLATLTELVAPTIMQFARTRQVAERYSAADNQIYGDAAILSDANRQTRNLLLEKAHLIPPDLLAPTQCLIAHHDIWLRRFEAELAEFEAEHGRSPFPDDPFDVGFAALTRGAGECGDFPEEVPGLFEQAMQDLRARLFEEE